ncbi:MAG: YdcF family protein [Acidobacteriota bacterium]|jgi:uncharacterized SAM-binding protein YcdF (DUF218 family)|nr:YdcF family protein [Acidobacteriota bacterium]
MYFLVRAVELAFSPLGVMVILLVLGLLLSLPRRRRPLGRKLLFCGAALFLTFLFSPLARALMFGLEKDHPPLLRPPLEPQVRKILILSGYAEEHPGYPVTSLLSAASVGNLTEGVRLYRLMPDAVIVVSGGVMRDGERSFAASMADFLVQMGVPSGRIQVEGESRSTYENLAESKAYLGDEPFILVAQACDMRRALAVARKLGMRPVPAPASYWVRQHYGGLSGGERMLKMLAAFVHPSPENLSRLQWAYHEYLGYHWYRLRGRI